MSVMSTTNDRTHESGGKRIHITAPDLLTTGPITWIVGADLSLGSMSDDMAQHRYAISRLLNLPPDRVVHIATMPDGYLWLVEDVEATWPDWQGEEPEEWRAPVDDKGAGVEVETPACWHCGKPSTVELTAEEHAAWVAGALIQVALPNRDDDFRELIKTGIHPKCWAEMFPEEDDDE